MGKTLVYSFILVASILLTSSSLVSVNDAGGDAGACVGDCTPPTMGVNSYGESLVINGLGINENYFDVDYHTQNLPTQILEVGKRNTITLTVYENGGPQNFQHLELHIAVIDKLVSAILIEDSLASIAWDVDFEGTETTFTKDPTNILQNVEVKREIKDVLTIITIGFEITQPMETNTIMVYQWDAKKNSWKNYFVDAISVVPRLVSPDLDSDDDGLPDLVEEQQGTDPNNPDTDGDGLQDGFEDKNKLDPLNIDSNGDGLFDQFEDLDNDGWDNLTEQEEGTDPLDEDTDLDGLPDPIEAKFGTSPTNEDSDGNGIVDGLEDFDNDGITNAEEFYEGMVDEIVGMPGLVKQLMSESGSDELPNWVENLFVWYGEEKISEDELIGAIQFLINKEII